MLNYLIVDKIINDALKEDIPYGDITASSIVTNGSKAKASLIAKEDGIICGLPVFERVFTILGDVTFKSFINEGSSVTNCSPSTPLPPSASESLLNKLSTKSIVQFPTNPTVKKYIKAIIQIKIGMAAHLFKNTLSNLSVTVSFDLVKTIHSFFAFSI